MTECTTGAAGGADDGTDTHVRTDHAAPVVEWVACGGFQQRRVEVLPESGRRPEPVGDHPVPGVAELVGSLV